MDIEIPYNVKEREDTGLYNSKLGIWLFLASEIMLFGALFSTYIILRTGDPTWMLHVKEAHLNIPLATINTAVLILSSVTFVMSWVSLKLKDLSKFKMYMGITLLCSVIFLVIKYFEYTSKFDAGHYPSTHNSACNGNILKVNFCFVVIIVDLFCSHIYFKCFCRIRINPKLLNLF